MRTYRSHINLAIAVVSFALTTNVAKAQTYTWNDSHTDFAASGSWDGGTPNWVTPFSLSNSIASFESTGPITNQPSIDTLGLGALELRFDSSDAEWTLSGSVSFSLGASGITTIGTGGTTTITANLVLAADHQSWNVAENTILHHTGSLGDGGNAYSLTKAGTGTLILGGTNTYTGGTTISGGTLQIGDGGESGSIVGNITNNSGSFLVFRRSNEIEFGGSISGGGEIRHEGQGTLTFTNTSSIVASNFSVENNGGTLFVNGTLIATDNFNHLGTLLGGTGTITTPLVIVPEGRTIRGGTPNTTGTLNIVGSLRLGNFGDAPATLQVEASHKIEEPGQALASKISITGGEESVLNLYSGLVIEIINNGTTPLQENGTYTITLASVDTVGRIRFDNIPLLNGPIDPLTHEYTVTGSDFAPTLTSLSIDGTNLVLTFTVSPVPEPGAVLGIAVGALAIGGLVRRRLRKPASVTAAVAV